MLTGKGRGGLTIEKGMLFHLTHHALSRSAQRWNVRTMEDLLKVVERIEIVVLRYIAEHENWLDTPPEGVRLTMLEGEGTIVVKKYVMRSTLVVATVF
jgi:hypothetical protein